MSRNTSSIPPGRTSRWRQGSLSMNFQRIQRKKSSRKNPSPAMSERGGRECWRRSCDVQHGLQGPGTFEPFANPHEGVVLESGVLTALLNTTSVAEDRGTKHFARQRVAYGRCELSCGRVHRGQALPQERQNGRALRLLRLAHGLIRCCSGCETCCYPGARRGRRGEWVLQEICLLRGQTSYSGREPYLINPTSSQTTYVENSGH